jgi:hypothetical protein
VITCRNRSKSPYGRFDKLFTTGLHRPCDNPHYLYVAFKRRIPTPGAVGVQNLCKEMPLNCAYIPNQPIQNLHHVFTATRMPSRLAFGVAHRCPVLEIRLAIMAQTGIYRVLIALI